MLESNIDINVIYQLVFVVLLFSLSLMFFVVLMRYTAWVRIHLDRVIDLYKRDSSVLRSSIDSLLIIGKSKGMDVFDEGEDEDEEVESEESEVAKGRYRTYTDI